MRPLAEIEQTLQTPLDGRQAAEAATLLQSLGEEILEHWISAHGAEPTVDEREGFRLLALHRQGTQGVPSFNACRETCRELIYHYNLIVTQPHHPEVAQRVEMMRFVTNHLYLFIAGKLKAQQLGDFCCASKPLRENMQ